MIAEFSGLLKWVRDVSYLKMTADPDRVVASVLPGDFDPEGMLKRPSGPLPCETASFGWIVTEPFAERILKIVNLARTG